MATLSYSEVTLRWMKGVRQSEYRGQIHECVDDHTQQTSMAREGRCQSVDKPIKIKNSKLHSFPDEAKIAKHGGLC